MHFEWCILWEQSPPCVAKEWAPFFSTFMWIAGTHSVEALPIKHTPQTSLRCAMHLELLPTSSAIISRVHLPCKKWRCEGQVKVMSAVVGHECGLTGDGIYFGRLNLWDLFLWPHYYCIVQDIIQKFWYWYWVVRRFISAFTNVLTLIFLQVWEWR